jgi:hypothetical protein
VTLFVSKKRYKHTRAEEALSELVRFAEAGETMPLKECRRVLDTVLDLPIGQVVIGPRAQIGLSAWTESEIRKRQHHTMALLRMIFAAIGFEADLSKLQIAPLPISKTAIAVQIDGPAADVLTYQTISLLSHVGLERLQQCACGQLYSRIGRQGYCSKRCQKRYYMRDVRRKERQSG